MSGFSAEVAEASLGEAFGRLTELVHSGVAGPGEQM